MQQSNDLMNDRQLNYWCGSIDQRTIGKWTIGKTLGKGGQAFVKQGEDIYDGRQVALKFMIRANNSRAYGQQMIHANTEIGAMKTIRHPNVLRLRANNSRAYG